MIAWKPRAEAVNRNVWHNVCGGKKGESSLNQLEVHCQKLFL